jgi:DNA-binding protein HU-beta
MTKAELINKVCSSHKNLTKTDCNYICDSLFEHLGKSIKKDKRFTYPGFGTWTVRNRKARKGRNPQTGQTINIPASRTVGFKPSPELKKWVS